MCIDEATLTLHNSMLQVIARTVCDTVASIDPRKRLLLLSYLHHTRGTLVGEILQVKNQHIVNLSHLTKPEVVIISVTPTYTSSQGTSLLAVPPHRLLDLCRALGLCAASYAVIPVDQAMDQKAQVSILVIEVGVCEYIGCIVIVCEVEEEWQLYV